MWSFGLRVRDSELQLPANPFPFLVPPTQSIFVPRPRVKARGYPPTVPLWVHHMFHRGEYLRARGIDLCTQVAPLARACGSAGSSVTYVWDNH